MEGGWRLCKAVIGAQALMESMIESSSDPDSHGGASSSSVPFKARGDPRCPLGLNLGLKLGGRSLHTQLASFVLPCSVLIWLARVGSPTRFCGSL